MFSYLNRDFAILKIHAPSKTSKRNPYTATTGKSSLRASDITAAAEINPVCFVLRVNSH